MYPDKKNDNIDSLLSIDQLWERARQESLPIRREEDLIHIEMYT
jgi:hypothetical protein